MDDYEQILLVKPEVFMYRIPPRTTNRAYRAADWKLDAPDWSGRLRIVSKGSKCVIKLEDKTSGELFAACPVDSYPGAAIEAVSDSARYFVLRIKDDGGRAANIGIGFFDRSDSFDFNVALQDHFKYLKQQQEAANQPAIDDGKKLDLSFKEGQTITINIGKKSDAVPRQKPKGAGASGASIGLLAPPPGSRAQQQQQQQQSSNRVVLNPPPSSISKPPAVSSAPTQQSSNLDLLLDLGDSGSSQTTQYQSNSSSAAQSLDDWFKM